VSTGTGPTARPSGSPRYARDPIFKNPGNYRSAFSKIPEIVGVEFASLALATMMTSSSECHCNFSTRDIPKLVKYGKTRSTRDLLNILHDLGQSSIGFKSLKDPWCDTTTLHGRLMLTVLGGIAEFERELINARTSEGRARAKARGVRFGRPPALTPHQQREALERLRQGETQADLARTYNVGVATINRLAATSPFSNGLAAGQ